MFSLLNLNVSKRVEIQSIQSAEMKDQASPTVVLNRVELHANSSDINETCGSPKMFKHQDAAEFGLIKSNGPSIQNMMFNRNSNNGTDIKKNFVTNSAHNTPISNKFSKSDGAVTGSGGLNNLNITENGNYFELSLLLLRIYC